MRYSAYKQYKDSGIEWLGEIPLFWKMTSLKRNVALNPSKSEVIHKKLVKCSFIPMESLKTDYLAIDDERVIESVYDGYTYFKDGDLLLAKVTPCFENRNIAVANELKNGIGFGSSEIYVIRPNHKIHTRFLFYYVQNEQFIQFAKEHMTGAGGLKRIPSEFLVNIEFPEISIEEQRKITDFLDKETAKINILIEKQKRLIQLLEEKRQAVISHIATKGLNPNVKMKDSGVKWVGDVPEHWKINLLSNLFINNKTKNTQLKNINLLSLSYGKIVRKDINTSHGLLPENFNTYQIVNRGNIILRLTDLQNDKKSLRTGYVNETGIITSAYIGLEKKSQLIFNEKYFYFFLHAFDIQKGFYGMGAGVRQSLTFEELKKLEFIIPPNEEQNEIVEHIEKQCNKIDKLIFYGKELTFLLNERRTALISAAVTGKVDVRNITSKDLNEHTPNARKKL
ncbi:restriction endonuclease subunit S [uncultured Legionella sp.]|uniref:restriction endonuclease subunit S n=1 Tax=uncultured Legionella sp. TaxID=210934 RepID=UPI002618152A|nr:restriction endonuclease subunit S [uncultured Legionella sp.]